MGLRESCGTNFTRMGCGSSLVTTVAGCTLCGRETMLAGALCCSIPSVRWIVSQTDLRSADPTRQVTFFRSATAGLQGPDFDKSNLDFTTLQ
jgi:hypothetical protein